MIGINVRGAYFRQCRGVAPDARRWAHLVGSWRQTVPMLLAPSDKGAAACARLRALAERGRDVHATSIIIYLIHILVTGPTCIAGMKNYAAVRCCLQVSCTPEVARGVPRAYTWA